MGTGPVGKTSGFVDAKASFEIQELTKERQRGSAQFEFTLKEFSERANSTCGADYRVDGVMDCSLNIDFSTTASLIRREFTGSCQTKRNQDGTLAVSSSQTPHRVGFDFSFKLLIEVNLNDKNQPPLVDLSASGTSTIDGTNYRMEDLVKRKRDACKT